MDKVKGRWLRNKINAIKRRRQRKRVGREEIKEEWDAGRKQWKKEGMNE